MKRQALLVLLAAFSSLAQGTFQNLDFESATVAPIPAGQSDYFVTFDEALPGWTGFVGTNQATYVWQNDVSLGAPNIAILGPYWSYNTIISGQYSVLLQAGT